MIFIPKREKGDLVFNDPSNIMLMEEFRHFLRQQQQKSVLKNECF